MYFNEIEYELIIEINNGFVIEDVSERLTSFYKIFDYVIGDWAYGKLRLKGFYDSKHKNVEKHNNILYWENYIKLNCAYGCKHFVLKKIEK